MADDKKIHEEEDYNALSREMIKKELLAKVEQRLRDDDPVVLNTLKTLISEDDFRDNL